MSRIFLLLEAIDPNTSVSGIAFSPSSQKVSTPTIFEFDSVAFTSGPTLNTCPLPWEFHCEVADPFDGSDWLPMGGGGITSLAVAVPV